MRSILVLLLFTYLPFMAHATSWRINNNVDRKAHFTDLNAAMKSMSVAEGDTLYLDPGCELPDSQSVTRKVCIIGTGYFLGSDTHESATIGGRLYLRSNGIKIEGAQVGGTTFLDGDHIKIERCKMGAIMVEGNAHYASVRQCYIEDGSVLCGSGRESQATYWTIENNIIRHSTGYDCVGYMNYPTIRNNYLCCAYRSSSIVSRITGGTITNNVIISLANHQYVFYQLSNCSVTNNILSASKDATYGANNKCLGSNQESTVFSMTGENDERFRLKENSPAQSYATDGGDCGPYGGSTPYIPSGYPYELPRFVHNSIVVTSTQAKEVRINHQVSIQKQ